MMRKRITYLIIAGIMSMSMLAGCGKVKTPPKPTASTSVSTEADTKKDDSRKTDTKTDTKKDTTTLKTKTGYKNRT